MTAQIVEISGQKMVMLPIEDYERLVDLAEDRADIDAAADAEGRRLDGEEYVPADLVDRLIAGENPLRVWRTYRGMTQQALGQAAGVSKMMVSLLERGQRDGPVRSWRALAEALGVSMEDIAPAA